MTVILAIASYFFFTGAGVKPDGTPFIGVSNFFGAAMGIFAILTIVIWMDNMQGICQAARLDAYHSVTGSDLFFQRIHSLVTEAAFLIFQ